MASIPSKTSLCGPMSAFPVLVAHRGFAKNYPENSLRAFAAAIKCGGKFLELDVQLTKDHVACVIHDDTLLRTGDEDISILGSNWADIEGHPIGEEAYLGGKFPTERLTSLKDFAIFLQKNEDVHAFVEIKEESIEKFGNKIVLESILNELAQIKDQCTLISFDAKVLMDARKISDYPIGFVVHQYDDAHFQLAKQLNPNIIICNYVKIPDENNSLWEGDWDWMIYEVTDPDIAFKWFERGINYIETMAFSEMMTAISEKYKK